MKKMGIQLYAIALILMWMFLIGASNLLGTVWSGLIPVPLWPYWIAIQIHE